MANLPESKMLRIDVKTIQHVHPYMTLDAVIKTHIICVAIARMCC